MTKQIFDHTSSILLKRHFPTIVHFTESTEYSSLEYHDGFINHFHCKDLCRYETSLVLTLDQAQKCGPGGPRLYEIK